MEQHTLIGVAMILGSGFVIFRTLKRRSGGSSGEDLGAAFGLRVLGSMAVAAVLTHFADPRLEVLTDQTYWLEWFAVTVLALAVHFSSFSRAVFIRKPRGTLFHPRTQAVINSLLIIPASIYLSLSALHVLLPSGSGIHEFEGPVSNASLISSHPDTQLLYSIRGCIDGLCNFQVSGDRAARIPASALPITSHGRPRARLPGDLKIRFQYYRSLSGVLVVRTETIRVE